MKHPGKVTYIDGSSGAVLRTRAADPTKDFVTIDGVDVPIVKIVGTPAGDQFFVKELGPEDRILRSTVMRAS